MVATFSDLFDATDASGVSKGFCGVTDAMVNPFLLTTATNGVVLTYDCELTARVRSSRELGPPATNKHESHSVKESIAKKRVSAILLNLEMDIETLPVQ
jgi:hypothetical protein